MKAIRGVIQLLGMIFLIGITFWFGWKCSRLALDYPDPFTPKKLVIEQLIDIQEQVGCKRIDGEIGPETTRLVNAQCIKDANEYFNKLAAKYFTPSGAPRKESNGNKESRIKTNVGR